MGIKHIREEFMKEGFRNVYEWTDQADTVYSEHAHKDLVSLYILQGSLFITIDDETTELTKGKRFDVPPGEDHSAYVGPEGCTYLVAEMIEGDS